MRAVLGIDAAWTAKQPSGVALAVEDSTGWRMVAAEPSYQRFLARADPALVPEVRPSGSSPDASLLIAAASALCGGTVDLVAIDMPLAHTAIVGRRVSDNAVSRAYGGRKCGTHSPNASRPGRIADEAREGFARAGYTLLTRVIDPPGLIEVYPHPALVELARAPKRLPYKAAKVRRYWPSATKSERQAHLFRTWADILALLEKEITGVAAELAQPNPQGTGAELKAYEDALDAIVCAWCAICALEGRAKPFGDDHSMIWIPHWPPAETTAAR